ncbi:MAG: ACP phosphodiesterase [Gammaproteobacteria bacterium]
MNFLAHCVLPELALPGAPSGLMVGGFLGDFLKGPVPEHLPTTIADGVRLHRRLDAFSNQHAAIRASCQRFPSDLRRVAPVFVDVLADHLLADRFDRYGPEPLTDFTARAYATLEAHRAHIPDHGQRFLRHAVTHDLFAAYATPDTLSGAIESVARRLGRAEVSAAVIDTIATSHAALVQDFVDYFPDLVAHAADWLTARGYL